jgi:hypothetical protein
MIIQQLSVFLENRSGRLTEVTAALGEQEVNISALCIAETSDFGILRMVVSDVNKAQEVLRARGFSLSVTQVICLSIPNQPGSVNKALRILSGANISIEYMYAFAVGATAFVIIRTNDVEQSIAVLLENSLTLVPASELHDH